MFKKIRERYIWLAGIASFLIARTVFGVSGIDEAVVGFLFVIASLHWYIVPFILKREMQLPGYPNIIFKKGEDNIFRLMFFGFGILMFGAAIGI